MVSSRTLILECDSDRASLGIFTCAGLRLRLLHREIVHFPLATASVADGKEAWFENVGAAFRKLRAKAKYRGPVTLVLPAHLCLTKFIKVPRVSGDQQEKILRFEAEQNIPYALSDVVWSAVTVSETASETEMLLGLAKLETLDAFCAAANGAGFEIQRVLPAPCATLAGFKLAVGKGGKNFLGLNIGRHATTLVLVEADRYAFRTFVAACSEDGCANIPEEPPIIAQAEPPLVKLQREVARSLLHFKWRSGLSKPERACIAGRYSGLAGLAEAVAGKLNVPVETCDFSAVIDFDAHRDLRNRVDGDAEHLIDLAGAAAICFERDHLHVNLLPPRMLERAGYRRRRPWFVAAALLASTVLLPPIFHYVTLRDEAAKKSAAIERELAPWRARDTRMQQNLRQIAEVRERIAFLQATSERRNRWIRFLAGLQTLLNDVEDVWLEKLQLAPSTTNAPMKLLVSGRMLDRARPLAKVSPETFSRVNDLLTRLAHAPFITAVESERFDPRQPGVLQFDFVLVSDPQQPL